MVKLGSKLMVSLITFIITVQLLFSYEVAAQPALDIRISQSTITVSAGNPATVQVTYENIGDTDLNLTLYIYDDGSIESSPRPTLLYGGLRFTTVIDTEVIFGSIYLPEGQSKQINVTFEVPPNMIGGNYKMHIGGYHEKVGNTYTGHDEIGFTLSVPSRALTRPSLISPSNGSQLTSIPTLQWSSVSGAEGYDWEIATSPDIDNSGYYFMNSICSGSTTSTSATIRCDLQTNIWYYWHVWAYAGGQPSPLSDTWRFMIKAANHNPVILYAGISPGSGNVNDTYIFKATYKDEDNDPPSLIQVYVDGSPYNMNAISPSDTNYTDGKEYKYETKLSAGTHNYYVYCEDGKGGSDRSPDSGTLTGPIVSCSAPSVPSLSYPSNGANNIDLRPTLSWSSVSGATSYTIQVSTSSSFSSYVINQSVSSASYTPSSNLAENTTYYWRVRAESSCGNSNWSSVWSFTTKSTCTAPSVPSLISPVNGATDVNLNPTLSWSSVSGATSYTIQVSTSSSFSSYIINQSVSSTSYILSGFAENTMYYWRVRAESSCGNSNWSSVWSFTIKSTCTAPSVPSISYPSYGAINVPSRPTFSWSSVSGATSYTIQVSTSSSFSSYVINQSVSSASYTPSSNLAENTTYYWRVRAESSCGNSNWSSVWSFTTKSTCTAPSVPSLSYPSYGATNIPLRPTFSWGSVSGATSYTIQVSTSSSFSSYVINQSVSSTSYTPSSNLAENTTYYWRMRAENNCGSSNWSSQWSFTTSCTALSAPSLISPVNGATDVNLNPTLSWSSVSGATSYTIQVSTSSSFSSYVINQSVSSTSYTPSSNLAENTTYYWRVRAENNCGYSDWSSGWPFSTPCPVLSAPSLISPAEGAPDVDLRPAFIWNAVSQATSYTIQVSTSSSFSSYVINQPATATSYTPSSDLTENTAYYWRVRAESNCGSSNWSSQWPFTTGSSCPVLSAPSLISPAEGAPDVDLRPAFIWNAVSQATSYTIQVSTSSSFSSYVINQPATATSYTPSSDLTENTAYYWRVRAENTCRSGEWSQIWPFTTSGTPCPTLPSPTVTTPNDEEVRGKAELSWNVVDGADSYNIQIGTTRLLSLESIVRAFETTSTSTKVKLPPGEYYWRVRAENKCGAGDWSKGDHHFHVIESSWWFDILANPIIQVFLGILALIVGIISYFRRKD